MYKFIAIVTLLAGVSAGRVPGRVVGGRDTTIEDHPYQVSLNYPGQEPICGGSIISSKWIVTAGHCISWLSGRNVVISAGKTLSWELGTVHRIERFILHPEFKITKYGTLVNDIGLIELRDHIDFDDTHASVQMYKAGEQTRVGEMGVVTGWGATKARPTDVLQEASIPIMDKDRCDVLYQFIGGLPQNEICAAYEQGGKDACQGDSGGPLTVNGRLAGIVSWGYDCALPGKPGVYTEVAGHRNWIRQHTGF